MQVVGGRFRNGLSYYPGISTADSGTSWLWCGVASEIWRFSKWLRCSSESSGLFRVSIRWLQRHLTHVLSHSFKGGNVDLSSNPRGCWGKGLTNNGIIHPFVLFLPWLATMFNITYTSLVSLGIISSAYSKTLSLSFSTLIPKPLCFTLKIHSSVYKVNNRGERTHPCIRHFLQYAQLLYHYLRLSTHRIYLRDIRFFMLSMFLWATRLCYLLFDWGLNVN